MRSVSGLVCGLLLVIAFSVPAHALDARFSTPERVMQWVHGYRDKPQPSLMPGAVHAMHKHGLFKDLEQAGLLVGFAAGVLGDNPAKADKLVAQMFPLPAKEQAVVIKAIAYSGLPDWERLLRKHAYRMPERLQLIEKYLSGEAKTLSELTLESGPEVLDTLWGYYAATNYHQPVLRIVAVLPWVNDPRGSGGFSFAKLRAAWSSADDKEIVNRITVGNMAKWTLAANAERDRDLLELYRMELKYQPEPVKKPLKEVIKAAESFKSNDLRKEALEAIEEVKKMNPGDRSYTTATYAGSVAIATACVIAGVTAPIMAAPCVVTGALYEGAVKMWNTAR